MEDIITNPGGGGAPIYNGSILQVNAYHGSNLLLFLPLYHYNAAAAYSHGTVQLGK